MSVQHLGCGGCPWNDNCTATFTQKMTSRLITTQNQTHTEMQHHIRQEFTYINLIMLYKNPII